MPIRLQLVGRNGRVIEASDNGELAVAALEHSTGTFQNMNVVDTAFNFHEPTAGKRLVVTGFIVTADRNVGVNGAVVEFYEADAVDSITVDKTVLRLDLPKSTIAPIGTNLLLSEGVFLNGKTDDASVLVTIAGYEVDA